MAIALGVLACEANHKVRFHTVTELVLKLSDAYRNGTLERLVRELKQLDLLILDEWGYVPVDREGSQLLFRVIADAYESKSLILTTNLEFSKWGGIFTEPNTAQCHTTRSASARDDYRPREPVLRQVVGSDRKCRGR